MFIFRVDEFLHFRGKIFRSSCSPLRLTLPLPSDFMIHNSDTGIYINNTRHVKKASCAGMCRRGWSLQHAFSMNKISIFHHLDKRFVSEKSWNRKTTLIPHPSAAFDALTQFCLLHSHSSVWIISEGALLALGLNYVFNYTKYLFIMKAKCFKPLHEMSAWWGKRLSFVWMIPRLVATDDSFVPLMALSCEAQCWFFSLLLSSWLRFPLIYWCHSLTRARRMKRK